MKQGVFLIGFCLVSFWAAAQNGILYASTTGADSWTGTSVQPLTLQGAVDSAKIDPNIKEIRLAVDQYGKAVYRLQEELVLRDELKLVGGYAHQGTERVINPAEMTVLQLKGNNNSRVVTVGKDGILEGVTITGGQCRGGNGGGVYVREGGKVVNCIIEGNVAIPRAPQVGDLLMKDGSYLSPDDFTYERKDEVKGVIFWINHDKTTQQEHRGLAVSTAGIRNVQFISSEAPINASGYLYKTEEKAIEDYDGQGNCDLLKTDPNCLAVQTAMEQGEGYYLPSIGELYRIYAVWHVLEETISKLWNVIVQNQKVTLLVAKSFFGTSISEVRPYDPYNPVDLANNPLVNHYLYSKDAIWSSTLQSNIEVFYRMGLFENSYASQKKVDIMDIKKYLKRHAWILPVVKF